MDPYNPLDKRNLGKSVADALLQRELEPLPSPQTRNGFLGAGVYAIYYFGTTMPYSAYSTLVERNQVRSDLIPIYVGKAVPSGARSGFGGLNAKAGPVLFRRLQEHAESIDQASNLELSDFKCRYLLVDDIRIPLGESLIIQTYKPIWNFLVGGFGNHDPGAGRRDQRRSAWDTVHPGRPWADRLASPYQQTADEIDERVVKFLRTQYPDPAEYVPPVED